MLSWSRRVFVLRLRPVEARKKVSLLTWTLLRLAEIENVHIQPLCLEDLEWKGDKFCFRCLLIDVD